REAGDADDGFDAVVDRGEPPGAGAAHAHARCADAVLIDFGSRFEVIDEALFVAQHHAPERAALPQIELEEAGFFAVAFVETPDGAFAHTTGREVAVDRSDDIAFLRQQRAYVLTVLF